MATATWRVSCRFCLWRKEDASDHALTELLRAYEEHELMCPHNRTDGAA